MSDISRAQYLARQKEAEDFDAHETDVRAAALAAIPGVMAKASRKTIEQNPDKLAADAWAVGEAFAMRGLIRRREFMLDLATGKFDPAIPEKEEEDRPAKVYDPSPAPAPERAPEDTEEDPAEDLIP